MDAHYARAHAAGVMSIKRSVVLVVQLIGGFLAIVYPLFLALAFWQLFFPNPEIKDPMHSTGVAWGLLGSFYLLAAPALLLAITMFVIAKKKTNLSAIKGSYVFQAMLVLCVLINSIVFTWQ